MPLAHQITLPNFQTTMKTNRLWILGLILATVAGYASHYPSKLKLEREIRDLRTEIAVSNKDRFTRLIRDEIEATNPSSTTEISKIGGYSHDHSRYTVLTADVIYFPADVVTPTPTLKAIADKYPNHPALVDWKAQATHYFLKGDRHFNLLALFIPASIALFMALPGARLAANIVFGIIYLALLTLLVAPLIPSAAITLKTFGVQPPFPPTFALIFVFVAMLGSILALLHWMLFSPPFEEHLR